MDDGDLTLRDYQNEASQTDRARGTDLKAVMIPLLGLAGEAGSLLAEYKKWLREGDYYRPFTDQVSEELGDILWYVANIAEKAGLDLQDIAQENLAKLEDRWPSTDRQASTLFATDRYDGAFPERERLPLTLRVEFRHVEVNGTSKLETTCNGQPFGNPLTDNAHVSDGYRFHDVFHFTNAALLGWSPVVRRQLKVKRKSIPQVDEVEDGARASITEEAISALVFGYAKDYSYFEETKSVEYDLLRAIKLMTRPFEVRDKSLRDWENAIIQGYRVWRQMISNSGGVLIADARTRTVSYEALSGC